MTADDGSSGISQKKGNESRKGKYRLALIGLSAALVVLALVAGCAVFLGGGAASGKPVPGHPDWRIVSLPIYYENGSVIEIIENRQATDPSYRLMINFLSDYGAPSGDYGTGNVCSSYAVELYDTAESVGIDAHMILVYFVGVVDPHSILAFDTTDKGRVYVDPTGLTPQEQAQGLPARFRLADAIPGSPYRLHFTSPYNVTEDTGNIVDRISSLS
jgi:hypothetical protein